MKQSGFMPQQAVEKCLKAVLALHAVRFRKTHDLVELVDLLHEHGVSLPPNAEALNELNPFAVTFRYDFIVGAMDREQMQDIVETVRCWAEERIQ